MHTFCQTYVFEVVDVNTCVFVHWWMVITIKAESWCLMCVRCSCVREEYLHYLHMSWVHCFMGMQSMRTTRVNGNAKHEEKTFSQTSMEFS